MTVATLTSRIHDFADIVSLVLVLITLFTGQREVGLDRKRRDAETTVWDMRIEVLLDGILLVATALIFVAGLRLWWDSATNAHPFGTGDGPVHFVFAVVWLLLVGLLVWQLHLLIRAWMLRSKVKTAAAAAEAAAKPQAS